jgi:tetratricopeptide (TPR) repeat protein
MTGRADSDTDLRWWRALPILIDPNRSIEAPPEYEAQISALADRLDDASDFDVDLLLVAGTIEFASGDPDLARRLFLKAAEIAQGQQDVEREASALHNLTIFHLSSGTYQTALTLAQQTLQLASKHDLKLLQVRSLLHLGQAMKATGQEKMARSSFEQAQSQAAEYNLSAERAASLIQLAWYDYTSKEFDQAIRKLNHAVKLCDVTGAMVDLVRARYNMGLVLADTKRYDEAQAVLNAALKLRDQQALSFGDNKIEAAIEQIERMKQSETN